MAQMEDERLQLLRQLQGAQDARAAAEAAAANAKAAVAEVEAKAAAEAAVRRQKAASTKSTRAHLTQAGTATLKKTYIVCAAFGRWRRRRGQRPPLWPRLSCRRRGVRRRRRSSYNRCPETLAWNTFPPRVVFCAFKNGPGFASWAGHRPPWRQPRSRCRPQRPSWCRQPRRRKRDRNPNRNRSRHAPPKACRQGNSSSKQEPPKTYAEAVERTKIIEATGHVWKCLDLNCKQWMHSEKSTKRTACSMPGSRKPSRSSSA